LRLSAMRSIFSVMDFLGPNPTLENATNGPFPIR
jgi:hypothetical protein